MIDQITKELQGWGLREVDETYPAPG